MHLWAMDFRILTARCCVPFQRFLDFYCRLRLNQSGSFTQRDVYPYLLLPNTYFFSCHENCETLLDFVQGTKLTTHLPIIMNDYNHANTPDSMRCPRAYVMQNANACISCYMYNEHYMEQFINRTSCQVPWIIISKTYNLYSCMLIYI